MHRKNRPISKDDFQKAALYQARRVGLVYDISNTDIDFLTYQNLAELMEEAELVVEKDELGKLRLMLAPAGKRTATH